MRPLTPSRLLLVALLLGFASPSTATVAEPAAAAPVLDAQARTRLRALRGRAAQRASEELREEWQASYRSLLTGFREIHAEQEAAAIERGQARQHQRRRGEPRRASDKRIEDAAKRRQEIYEELEDFYRRARADAIERVWLLHVEDDFPDLGPALPDRG